MAIQSVTVTQARPLPVFLLLDVSGSMSVNGKMEALNQAAQEFLETLAAESTFRSELQVAIITFGGTAQLHLPLTQAKDARWTPMQAQGGTPLGEALTLLTGLIEDPAQVPSRAYRPTVVLASDGQPNGAWEAPLEHFLKSPRASKAFRFALGIGEDADQGMLKRFLADPQAEVYTARHAKSLIEFFRWVTMSVTARSHSATPDAPMLEAQRLTRVSLQSLPAFDPTSAEF